KVDHRLRALAVLEAKAAQLATQPAVECAQRALALGVAVVCHPSRGKAVHLLDHPGERDAPIAAGDRAQAVLDAGQATARDATATPRAETVAGGLAFLDRGDGALPAVVLEPKPTFQEGS